MESFKIVDDNTKAVLLETDEKSDVNAWKFAYDQIKKQNNMNIFIEVYDDGKFSHWVDSESIVNDVELSKEINKWR